jgi:hypothetical protein
MEYKEIAAKKRKKRKSSLVYTLQYTEFRHFREDFFTEANQGNEAGIGMPLPSFSSFASV